jgi:cytochrome P450
VSSTSDIDAAARESVDDGGGLDEALREQIRNFDHHAPEVAATIHTFLGNVRAQCPIAWSEQNGGFFLVASQDLIAEVARDHNRFSSAVRGLGAVMLLPDWDDVTAPLFETDPPEHTLWRRIMQPYFPAGVVAARYEPHIRAVTRRVLSELRPQGEGDLVDKVAARIPLLVVAELLGIPADQREQFSAAARRFFAAGSLPTDEARLAAERYLEFLRAQIVARRDVRGDDLLSCVVHARIGGEEPTELELLKFAFLMVAAGHLTTCDTIGNTLYVLAQDRPLRERIIAEPNLIPDLIAESVRYEAAVAATGRTVRQDTVLGGVALPKKGRVLVLWGSGTRDERYFANPDEFELGRDQGRELAWGAGVHRCLGQHLARLELRIVLEEFLACMPDFELVPDAQITTTYGVTRGVTALPARWPV